MGEKMDGIEVPVRMRVLLLLFGRTQNRKRGLGTRKDGLLALRPEAAIRIISA
jgi:hypothetical protein